MAETVRSLDGLDKPAAYAVLREETFAVLEGIDDEVTAMATIASLVHHGFQHLWTGFYRVVVPGKLLRVGPYQGTLGCLDIAFGKGVCGAAAAEQRTIVVDDVHAFPGHITCDGRSRSEIVAPVFDKKGALIAVFDIDSDKLAAFDDRDRAGLEALLTWFARR
jgi:L-methionine (R)-S-oxide reductase